MSHEIRAFSTKEALQFGWKTTRANLQPLIMLSALGVFASLAHEALVRRDGSGPFFAFGMQIVQALLAMAMVRVALKLHDGRTIDWSRPGDLVVGFLPFLLTSALYGMIVAGGLLLLVVPGLYWAVKLGFATFAAVDADLDPITALRESSRLTAGERWHLLGFALLLFGINLLGALAFGLGLTLTIPTTAIAAAFVFRRLQARARAKVEPAVGVASGMHHA